MFKCIVLWCLAFDVLSWCDVLYIIYILYYIIILYYYILYYSYTILYYTLLLFCSSIPFQSSLPLLYLPIQSFSSSPPFSHTILPIFILYLSVLTYTYLYSSPSFLFFCSPLLLSSSILLFLPIPPIFSVQCKSSNNS